MKIQLSPKRIAKDYLTVWHEHGPEVDIVMSLENLTFAPNSIESIFAHHVIDHLFPEEAEKALKNWYACLKSQGSLYIVVDDFEYIARRFVAGEIGIDMLNESFNHPMQFSKDNAVKYILGAGFNETEIRIWYADIPDLIKKQDYELVLATTKL